MEILGLIFELAFFAFGLFAYLFAIGKIKTHETQRPMVERIRLENGRWMRIMGLLLMAISAIEIVLHITQMVKK